ncbi:hypothetical protein FQN57_005326 [Myotisia sp. PD_48]|nr:hypothetical protein FQN57_005326 [Myotisia sp. PD_48]
MASENIATAEAVEVVMPIQAAARGFAAEDRNPIQVPHTPRIRGRQGTRKSRASDPGLIESQPCRARCNPSTGLTPMVSRTSLGPNRPGESPLLAPRNKWKRRDPRLRYSAPCALFQLQQTKADELLSNKDINTFQFLPFHDILDARTRRRMGRSGFSEEMNKIEKRDRDEKRSRRKMDEKLRQLQKELEALRNENVAATDQALREDTTEPQYEAYHLTTEQEHGLADSTAIFDVDEMDADNSPCFTPLWTPQTMGTPVSVVDSGVQASLPDLNTESKFQEFTRTLARKSTEQRYLFDEWRRLSIPSNDQSLADEMDTNSTIPPPDLEIQVISTLQENIARAAKATESINILDAELSGHGFDGENAVEIISNISSRFRHARLELERAVPGETADAGFSNWKNILDALVKRIQHLANAVTETKGYIKSVESRESALRRQFDATLRRLEEATKKTNQLEQYSDNIAEDMLTMRMTLQTVERDLERQESDKTRLQEALGKYRDDILMLERLNSTLEDDLALSAKEIKHLERLNSQLKEKGDSSEEKIRELEMYLKTEREFNTSIQSSIDERDAKIADLNFQIYELEVEKDQLVVAFEQTAEKQSNDHQREVGAMNSRLSMISTSLSEIRAENETLKSQKAKLQDRIKHMSRLSQEWQRGIEFLADGAHEDCTETVANKDSFTVIGGEPITPSTGCRFRNVEFERGTKRRRGGDRQVDVLVEEWSDDEEDTLLSNSCKRPYTAPLSPQE